MRSKALVRFYTILKLLDTVNQAVGKTFIQKALYIIKEGFSLDLDYQFRLYYYGPYSDKISGDIDTLESGGLLRVEHDNSTGYQISITSQGKNFIKNFETEIENIEEINEKINKVLKLSENKTAREMELLGTTLYFLKFTKDERKLLNSVKMTKPHFTDIEIQNAIQKIKSTTLN
ncbi:hypothetical protein [Thermodesulfovibrio yellowstonii]|uniref:Antitoxin SocA-like Panacea domain-containing protein n=1 Tax=Thermodesulfovibrio yellowstonii TaxID=28262 RepID=A0A9W6GEJ1_9BACT|nr:hypothetical protein [Thermodesulfovibrio islandicus]GLI52675.1 hypothetical protein TISLANDTSLP1_03680 [Thermodesulfovibrio islandicus]